jgi:hypothetical protein
VYDPKYITYNLGGVSRIVVFGAGDNHSDIARSLNLSSDHIVGAGFVNFRTRKCYGKSESLKVSSSESDTLTLQLHFNLLDDD